MFLATHNGGPPNRRSLISPIGGLLMSGRRPNSDSGEPDLWSNGSVFMGSKEPISVDPSPQIPLQQTTAKYKQINSAGCKLWVKEESMKPIRVPDLAPEQLTALEDLYRSTRSVRLRTRAQMVLLAAERGLTAREIAEIVRSSEETVRRWLKR